MKKISLGIKRAFDIVSSGILIVLLTPVWIGTSIAIKKDSEGPVFFKQGRRTKDGEVFQIFKSGFQESVYRCNQSKRI